MSVTLRARAKKLYDIAHKVPEIEAIETIAAVLRITRQEGITRGAEIFDQHSHQLPERKSV